MKHYIWRVEDESSFYALYSLLYKTKQYWSADHVKRRIIIPLFLGQLVGFYDEDEELRGFLTFAFMNEFCADHQPTLGVLPKDWRSGPHLWVVDFIALADGDRMLRTIMRDTYLEDGVRFFRAKYGKTREKKPCRAVG